MRSAAKLSYAQAQAAIDGAARRHHRAAGRRRAASRSTPPMQALKNARDAREPLDLDLPERKILLKPDGTVDRVITPQRLDAHQLIEEFMILANVAAAETLEAQPHAADLPRARRAVAREDRVRCANFLQTLDISLAEGRRAAASTSSTASWRRSKGHDDEPLVNEVVLRSQSQAEYAVRELRPFRLEPAPLRAFHLADPPLRRSRSCIAG